MSGTALPVQGRALQSTFFKLFSNRTKRIKRQRPDPPNGILLMPMRRRKSRCCSFTNFMSFSGRPDPAEKGWVGSL